MKQQMHTNSTPRVSGERPPLAQEVDLGPIATRKFRNCNSKTNREFKSPATIDHLYTCTALNATRIKPNFSSTNWPHVRPVALVTLAIVTLAAGSSHIAITANAQCSDKPNQLTSFERIGGVTIKDAQLTILYQANMSQATIGHHHHSTSAASAAAAATSAANSTTTLYHISTPITAECNNRCRKSKSCRAFLVDYARHTCWSVDHQTGGGGGGGGQPMSSFSVALDRAPAPIHLVPTGERTAYFEKVCLSAPPAEFCERAWIFERVLSYHIPGHDDKIIDDVASRLKCQEHCLNERSFRCRSGEYDHLTMQCRLSMTDRHIKPTLFRPATHNVDYFENQCVPTGHQCDAFDRYEDMDLGRAEIMRNANNSEQCQQICTQTIKAFVCRSFTWSPLTGRCYLNSVNTFMVGGADKLLTAPGLVYYQRNECVDLKLECDHTAMTLNLRTNEPFRGRMYVRDDPNACETLGRSALLSSLSIPFQSPMGRCAQRELPSRYSSVVVVQQHPLIQRKSDRYIKLVCDFQTANRTIVSQYNVMNNPWTSTALINATSHAPKILLRITDKFGNDITGAKLGDELQLRIEAESESVYDMVARSVLAKSGTTDESIVLIDRDGCPADSRIFPPLKKLNKRTIIGRFDAFKFSSDVVVRFQVDVQFCLNSCPPTNCLDPHSAQGGPGALFNVNSARLGYQDSVTDGPATGGSGGGNSQVTPNLSPPLNADGQGPADSPNALTSGGGEYAPRSTTYRPPTGSSTGGGQSDVLTVNALDYGGGGGGGNDPLLARRGQPPVNQPLQSAGGGGGLNMPTSDQLFDSQAKDPGSRHLVAPGEQHPTLRPNQHQLHQQQQHLHKIHQYNKQMYNRVDGQNDAEPTGGQVSGSGGGGDLSVVLSQQAQQDSQNSHSSKRRRRRSTEPLPDTPKHVPLQREIIVIESSTDGPVSKSNKQRAAGLGADKTTTAKSTASARNQRDMKTVGGGGGGAMPSSATNMMRSQEGQAALNANKYDLHDPVTRAGEQMGRAADLELAGLDSTGSLVCTTWTSLGLSLAAFCALQLLSMGLCLASWAHNRRGKQQAKHRPMAAQTSTAIAPNHLVEFQTAQANQRIHQQQRQTPNGTTQHKLLFDGRQQFF